MKKEASGKKGKWLWLVLGLVVILAVVGVVLALVFGRGNGSTIGGRPDLYWNVDRVSYTDRDTGLSTREPAEDGNFYVRFAHDGEQVEFPVADKKLVNYIDAQDVMGLTLDDNGFIVDIQPIADVATVIGESLYIQNVSGDTITANSSIAMNGRKVVVKLTEEISIYNVSGKDGFAGEKIDASAMKPMDTINVYGSLVPEDSEEESVVTHVFLAKKPVESKIYWRAEQFYNSTNKVTTREPDENGDYTIKFYCEGETLELKCKDKTVVTSIDSISVHWAHTGLEFDENGYIIDEFDSFLGSRTLMQCQRFDITELNEDGSYTATSLIKNDGSFVQGVIGADCPIYDVSKAALAEGQVNRRVDSLAIGDRVCIWTDTMGKPVLVYITNHMVESAPYWNVTRMYDSTTKTTKREPNAKGYYEVELLKAGDTKAGIYYIKDVETMTALDANSNRCVGLRVGEGNIIECVYDMECIFGYGSFCRGYYVVETTGSVATFLSNAGSGYTMNGVLSSEGHVWNVSTVGTFGEETTLQFGDSVYAARVPTGEIINAYVTRRYLGEDTMYWRLSAQEYDKENKVTTRKPDAEGYYVYEMAYKGNAVTLKTKDKEIASFIDSYGAPALSLKVRNGIILEAHDGLYAVGGFKYSGWFVKEIGDTYITIVTAAGREETVDLSANLQVYNVSNSFRDHKGEKTSLQLNDYVYVFFDVYTDVSMVYVWGRETSKMAWPVAPQYDSTNLCTTREPDADGWYYIDLAVDGVVKTYKCKNKDIISGIDSYITPVGIEVSGDVIKYYSPYSYVKNVKSTGVTNYTVSAVNGNTITALCTLGDPAKVGTKEKLTLASNAKIYDVSADAEKFGAPVKLKAGDTIRTYTSDDGDTLYVYVVAHCNRAGGYMSLCDHCGKVVYWNAYNASANVVAYDCHYYLASDVTVTAQLRVYSNARDFETVLDLNGHTLTRNGGRASLIRYGDTLTVLDSVGGGKIETSGKCDMGTVLMVSDGTVNMHGGTLSHITGEDPAAWSYAGGLVFCNTGTFNMYGGSLANGEVFADETHEAYGGAVRLSSGTFNMYGGRITGSKAYSKTFTTADGTEKTNSSYGGNIYAEKESKLNIYGGTIENGEAGSRGGNIYAVSGTTVNITKGAVAGGVAGDRGGNIFNQDAILNISGGEVVNGTTLGRFGGNIMSQGLSAYVNISGTAKVAGGVGKGSNPSGTNILLMYSNLVLTGGEITGDPANAGPSITVSESGGKGSTVVISGGTVSGAAEALVSNSALSKITISGGTLMGKTSINNIADITLSGKPVFENLTLGDDVRLNLNQMEAGADITVDAAGVFTKPNAAAYKDYFTAADAAKEIGLTADNALKVHHPGSTSVYCEHCQSNIEWMPWDGTADHSGHFFLQDNITLTDRIKIGGSTEIVLDLNGKTITAAADNRAFYVLGNLSVVDNASGGAITGGKAAGSHGGNIYVDGGTFTLYSGAVTNGVAEGGRGGNLYATSNGTINIKGGTVSGGTGTSANNIYAMYSTINISGGEVIGNNTGTEPSVAAGGSSGKISHVNISGGKLTGSAINLSVATSLAEVNISGGELDGQTAISKVSKLDISGKPVIQQLKIGDATLATLGEVIDGANIVVDAAGVFTTAMSSQEVAEGYLAYITAFNPMDEVSVTNSFELSVGARESGADVGQFYCNDCNQTVSFTSWAGSTLAESGHYYLTDDVILSGEMAIPAGREVVIELNGHTIKAADGCRSFNVTGKLSIQDSSTAGTGKIVGNTVANNGANIYIENGEFNLYSGTVTGGHASNGKYGGNLYVTGANARVNISGGTVSDGIAGRAGNIYIYQGAVAISGNAQILDGFGEFTSGSTGRAGNIYVTDRNATLEISGNATVSGGHAAKNGGNIFSMYANVTLSGNAQIKDGIVDNRGSGENLFISGTDAAGASQLTISGGTVTGGDIYLSGTGNGATVANISGGKLNCLVDVRSIQSLIISGNPVIENLYLSENTIITELGTLTDGASIGVSKALTSGSVPNLVFTDVLSNAAEVKTYFHGADVDKTVVVDADNRLTLAEACPCGCGTLVSEVAWVDPATYFASSDVTINNNKITIRNDVHIKLNDNYTLADKQILIGASNGSVTANVVIDLNGYTWTANLRMMNYRNCTLTILDTSAAGTGTMLSSGSSTAAHGGLLANYGTVNLYGGKLTQPESGSKVSRGGVIYQNQGIFNMYGGIITGGTAITDATHDASGGNIFVYSGTFNLYGGTISGGTAMTGTNPGRGGNIYVKSGGTLNVYGGTITGGTADEGADVYLEIETAKGAILNAEGGNIVGEVYVPGALATVKVSREAKIGKLTLAEDSLVTVGILYGDAGIGVNKQTAFTDVLKNAALVKSFFRSTDSGKSVVVDADNRLTLAEACPCGCGTLVSEVAWVDPATYFASSDVTINNNKITIRNDVHIKLNDNYTLADKQILIGASNGSVTANVVIDLNGYTWTANLRMMNYRNCTLTILDTSAAGTGTMLSSGSSTAAHGGLLANYGTVNLYGGKLTQPESGSKVSRGGVIYQNQGIFNMYGGIITGGTAITDATHDASGGNIFVYSGTFNLYGGTISGGTAMTGTNPGRGGNIYVKSGATLNVYNGTITDGTAAEGYNVYLEENTTFNHDGGTIIGNVGDATNGVFQAS